jgi:hypothetical protein
MDRRILSLAREVDPRYAHAIPREAEAMLLLEQLGETPQEVQETLQQATLRWHLRRRLAFGSQLVLAPDEYDLFRRLARRVSPTLYRVRGLDRPTPFVEDIAVPPDRLPDFITAMHQALRTRQVTASFFAHAGHGQLHIRPFLNLRDPAHLRMMPELASDLYEHALALGGTMAGEHGCGLSRTWFMRRQFGPLYDVFREVKRIFDPANLLNPGKVVADVPQPLVKNLRRSLLGAGEEPEPAEPGPLPQQRRPRQRLNHSARPSRRSNCISPGPNRSPTPPTAATAVDVAEPNRPNRGCVPSFASLLAKKPRPGPKPTCCGRSPPISLRPRPCSAPR